MKTTKELARELGFLRRRTYSTSGCTSNSGRTTGQFFKYLIVIDFESTCWQEAKFRTQEIIEFPAVLLNTLTGQIESEFHFYVQPQEQPVLSKFCTELTGITQGQVDEGIPVNLCLRKFTHWLDKLYREKTVVCDGTKTEHTTPINCTCVTWSDWDLGVCLLYECKRKQLLKPPQLNTWIDLRATYRKFYDRKPNGLNGALQDLGIEFQGREHSGVDDARNTAKLAYRMIRDGCILKTTKTLKTHERSSSCNVQFRDNTNLNGHTRTISPPQTVSGSEDIRAFIGKKKTPKKKNPTPKKQTPKKTDRITLSKSTASKPSEVKTPRKASPKTPNKIKESIKRKNITPIKSTSNKSSDSPCRKVPRRVSPRKFSASDIYRDPESTTPNSNNVEKRQLSSNKGLHAQDMNVQRDTMFSKSVKSSHSEPAMDVKVPTVFNHPTPVSKSTQKCCNGDTFKVPLPLAKSPAQRTKFCTSTPHTGHTGQRLVTPRCGPSPIQAEHTPNGTKSFDSSEISSISSNSCQSGSFKTPSMRRYEGTSSLSSYSSNSLSSMSNYRCMTDSNGGSTNESKMKVTPPLCKCGRRSKRRMVQSPGQNMGRLFFTCTVRQSVASKKGCDFFKWETSLGFDRGASVKNVSKQFTPVMGNRFANVSVGNGSQKRNLGVRSNNSQRLYCR